MQKWLNRSICCLGCGIGCAEGNKFSHIYQVAPMCPALWAHWHHLANIIEPSVCGGDAVLCQITLTTCFDSCAVMSVLLTINIICNQCEKLASLKKQSINHFLWRHDIMHCWPYLTNVGHVTPLTIWTPLILQKSRETWMFMQNVVKSLRSTLALLLCATKVQALFWCWFSCGLLPVSSLHIVENC